MVKSFLGQNDDSDQQENVQKTNLERIFYFNDWGGKAKPKTYLDKRKSLDTDLVTAPRNKKLSVILKMIKLALSQNLGQEALGYLNMASSSNNQIAQTPEFKALKGAAHFLASQYDESLQYFSDDDLQNISEISLWRAAAYASMNKNSDALDAYKDNALLASTYPNMIKFHVLSPLGLSLIQERQIGQANVVTALLDENLKKGSQKEKITVAYLKGLVQSLSGHPDKGNINLYKAANSDKNGPFGIRSELLLIQDELAREVITSKEAIKRMERLRFAWRGDSLETTIQKSLGELYINSGDPRRGLTVLKRATKNINDPKSRRNIVRTMADAFRSLFIGNKFQDTDPLVSVTVYDEFKELTPIGDEGNQIIDKLADKLMSINLMSRATNVLTDKMDRLGEGQHAIETGLRITRIQLLDQEPGNAQKTLNKIDRMMAKYQGDDKGDFHQDIVLLKAKVASDIGDPEKALFMTEGLDDTDDVIRLRVDTAWRSGKWVAATDNLGKLLARQNITPATPPTADQAQLILNQAVALSLSDQHDALQQFSVQYDTAMKQTPVYKMFKIVTRPQNISNLADRETLMDVTAEVDLFSNALKNNIK